MHNTGLVFIGTVKKLKLPYWFKQGKNQDWTCDSFQTSNHKKHGTGITKRIGFGTINEGFFTSQSKDLVSWKDRDGGLEKSRKLRGEELHSERSSGGKISSCLTAYRTSNTAGDISRGQRTNNKKWPWRRITSQAHMEPRIACASPDKALKSGNVGTGWNHIRILP